MHAPRARTWGFTCYASPMRPSRAGMSHRRCAGCKAPRKAWGACRVIVVNMRVGDAQEGRVCFRMPHVHARGVSRVTHLRCASGRSGCPARLRRAWLRGGIFACPTCTHVGFRMLRISDALPGGRVSNVTHLRCVSDAWRVGDPRDVKPHAVMHGVGQCVNGTGASEMRRNM